MFRLPEGKRPQPTGTWKPMCLATMSDVIGSRNDFHEPASTTREREPMGSAYFKGSFETV